MRALLALAGCLTIASAASAQRARQAGIRPPVSLGAEAATPERSAIPKHRVAPAWPVLGSAAIPGAGQALLGQDRWVVYVAAEAFFWISYVQHRRTGRRERDRYRALAADVARSPFATRPAPGTFEYYESMEQFIESGAFDAFPGGLLDPEPDTATFNGRIWLLARRTYWSDLASPPPRESREWRLAESFYRRRAVGPELRWSWRDAQLEYDEFRRTIRRSNDAYRSAITDASVIIANHLLSTVDALAAVRLEMRSQRGSAIELRLSVPASRARSK
ncbi:MAG: hypothetical protein ACT4R6_08120 [Gemmatimonadaceae bacterium]